MSGTSTEVRSRLAAKGKFVLLSLASPLWFGLAHVARARGAWSVGARAAATNASSIALSSALPSALALALPLASALATAFWILVTHVDVRERLVEVELQSPD